MGSETNTDVKLVRDNGTVAGLEHSDRSEKPLNCNHSKSCMCARVTHESHTYARLRFTSGLPHNAA